MTTDVAVLTFHSISEGPGPTKISPSVFEMQMEELAASGVTVLTLDQFLVRSLGSDRADGPAVLITFDDALADFTSNAFPILARVGFPSLMFAPTGKIGAFADWDGDPAPQPLMSWDDARDLQAKGVAFGAHGVRHVNLTGLDDAALGLELDTCKSDLAEKLGRPVRCFAAPYGATDARVRRQIAARFDIAFGVRLATASADAPRDDIPRVDMHYFRDRSNWRAFLKGDRSYFNLRRAARSLRGVLTYKPGARAYG